VSVAVPSRCLRNWIDHAARLLGARSHRATDEQWARNLDSAWKQVETLAGRLARQRVVRTPLHPDWEG